MTIIPKIFNKFSEYANKSGSGSAMNEISYRASKEQPFFNIGMQPHDVYEISGDTIEDVALQMHEEILALDSTENDKKINFFA